MTRPAGRVKGVLKSRGSGRVGSGRVGSGRVTRFQTLAGWAGRVKRLLKARGSGRVMTRELFSADPRVEPADLICGFAFLFKCIHSCLSEGRCRAGALRVGSADPIRGSEDDTTKLAASFMKASLVQILRPYVMISSRIVLNQTATFRTRHKVLLRESPCRMKP